jgi:2-polyprenyl-3-methyl-5-hydroxy-6-metoxy-1,4-benzoquinol methylase
MEQTQGHRLPSQVDRWYINYWERLQAREKLLKTLRPPCLFWCWSDELNEIERLYYHRTKTASRILDFGAGDGRLKRKFLAAGYKGSYDTLDISSEGSPTYSSLADVTGQYDAIFCLEVIEHMTLNEYVDLMEKFDRLLGPGGILAIGTPNPSCVIPMWSQDAGHIQQFPLPDLAADFIIRGYSIETFRVRLGERPKGIRPRIRFFLQRVLCYLLGADYANGLVVIGNKKAA